MENVILINSDFNYNYNYNYNKEIEAIVYKKYMNLKYSIWKQMEFLSETMEIEDPQFIINVIRKQVEEAFVKYSPAINFFEESS